MADRKTDISDIFKDTKGLVKIINSSPCYTVQMFIDSINETYNTNLTLSQARSYIKGNGLKIRQGKFKIKKLNDYLEFLKKLSKLAENTKDRSNPGTMGYRVFGNPHRTKGKGRTVNYGRTGGAI